MVIQYLISDKNVVGLLLLLRSKVEIATADMSEINGFCYVKGAALKLRSAKLITSEPSDKNKNKLVWKLTPKGKKIADNLSEAEFGLTQAFR